MYGYLYTVICLSLIPFFSCLFNILVWEILLFSYQIDAVRRNFPTKGTVFLMDKFFFLFITSILKSLVILAIWLALNNVIYSQIAPFHVLNCIFFSANETALLKHNNESNFKACLKKSIKLWEDERQL